MFTASLASLVLTCTTVFSSNGGDPHSREHVTRVQVDYQKQQALVKEYSFEAFEAWGVEDVEQLLVDTNLSSKPFLLRVEGIASNNPRDEYDTVQLSFDDSISARLWSTLTIMRDGTAKNEVALNGRTYSEAMTCKFSN